MNRRIDQSNDSRRERLLAYIEREVTAAEADAIEASLDETAEIDVESLRRLRRDRDLIRSIGEVAAPVDLIEDVLASVERSALLDEAPEAPAIQIQRRRGSGLRRFAVAAGLVLLLGGAGMLLIDMVALEFGGGRTDEILTNSGREYEAERAAAGRDEAGGRDLLEREGDSAIDDGSPRLAESEDSATTGGALALNSGGGENLAADSAIENASANATERESASWRVSVVHEPPPSRSIDSGLKLVVTTSDMRAALDTLNQSLCAGASRAADEHGWSGGGLVWNLIETPPRILTDDAVGVVSLTVAGEDRRPASETFSAPGHDPGSAIVSRSDHRRRWDPAEFLIVGPNNLVPFASQCAYGRDGFQLTLVGAPSQVMAALQALDRLPGQSAQWLRLSGHESLKSLIPPPPLEPFEWLQAIGWWRDPAARDSDLVRRAALSLEPEPVIRIPVRIRNSPGGGEREH